MIVAFVNSPEEDRSLLRLKPGIQCLAASFGTNICNDGSTAESLETDDGLRVKTSSGYLLGKRECFHNKYVKSFLGVPYAEPPVGELRFKRSVPFKTEEERLATSFSPICQQPPQLKEIMSPLLVPSQAKMNEDCLYLNLHVPEGKNHVLLPVMVWLAGEGFNFANPLQFHGIYLPSTANVIFVTLSYRVSAFGFLSTLDDTAPGNAGLWDQRLALQWIQENIEQFGGDKNNVTLFGHFTGAMAVAIHAFSPLSKNEILFHRIILHGGVPDGDWIFDRNPLNATFALAQATDCLSSTISEIVECLRKVPPDALLDASLALPFSWRPVIDFSLIHEPVLSAAARSNYNPVEVLIGVNTHEGSLCISATKALKSELFEKIVENTLTKQEFVHLLEISLMDVYNQRDSFVNNLIVFRYSVPFTSESSRLSEKYVKFCGDLYIIANSYELANILSKSNKTVYLYEFTHRPSFSKNPSFIQAGHGDDVLYALGLPLQLKDLPEEELALTKDVLESISNFAYYGNPNPKNSTSWPSFTSESRLSRKFSTFSKLDIQRSADEDAAVFWHEIVPSAYDRRCPIVASDSSKVAIEDKKQDQGTSFFSSWLPSSSIFCVLPDYCEN